MSSESVRVQKSPRRDAEGFGYLGEVQDGDVADTPLNARHVGTVDVRTICERFLGKPLLIAEVADSGAEALQQERSWAWHPSS